MTTEIESGRVTLDGQEIPFSDGETIMDAALRAGIYIPHLCHRPGYEPHGSCKLCTVRLGERRVAACTTRAEQGMRVQSESAELNADRLALVQMLFVEGNHTCPSCEKSGACPLQSVAYHLGMVAPRFAQFYPARDVDASHADVWLDRNRCILCDLCVRASRDVDGKGVFEIAGRGMGSRLIINSETGRLADSTLAAEDSAIDVCPTGALLRKRQGFAVPIGRRRYDRHAIDEPGDTDGDGG